MLYLFQPRPEGEGIHPQWWCMSCIMIRYALLTAAVAAINAEGGGHEYARRMKTALDKLHVENVIRPVAQESIEELLARRPLNRTYLVDVDNNYLKLFCNLCREKIDPEKKEGLRVVWTSEIQPNTESYYSGRHYCEQCVYDTLAITSQALDIVYDGLGGHERARTLRTIQSNILLGGTALEMYDRERPYKKII